MEGADNVAYICNAESLKEDRGGREGRGKAGGERECGRVLLLLFFTSASLGSRSPFPYVVHPRFSSPIPPVVTGFLTEALLRYLFV